MDWREELQEDAEELNAFLTDLEKEYKEQLNPQGVSILTVPPPKKELASRPDEDWQERIAENLPDGVEEYLDAGP